MEILFILGWIVCGVLAYGVIFAYNQKEWPPIFSDEYYWQDAAFSVYVGLFGPIGLIVSYFMTEFAKHGLKFK